MQRQFIQREVRSPKAIARPARDVAGVTEDSDLAIFGRLFLVVAIFVTAIATFNHYLVG